MTSCSSRMMPATKRSTMYWSTNPGVYFDASPNFSRISAWLRGDQSFSALERIVKQGLVLVAGGDQVEHFAGDD